MTGPTPQSEGSRGVWSGEYLWVTVGAVALIFLAAVQSLAVTTVMPIVSADLDGERLYAVAFAGMLATSVIGMVVTGAWCDRGGVLVPLSTAVGFFVVGLIIAGSAQSMELLVVGRLIQGLGSGGQIVALYVVVARVYPPILHGRVFAAFSAAWVVPSLVGPFLAGLVAEVFHWRWVFLGVAALTVLAFLLVLIRLYSQQLSVSEPSSAGIASRIAWAVLVSIGALGLSFAEQAGPWAWAVVAASLVLIVVAVRPLLPPSTLRAGRGLPSAVLMRGFLAGALFGAEVYVPLLLVRDYGFTAVWAGLALTTAALAWAVAAEVQGRIGERLGNRRITLWGTSQMIAAFSVAVATAVWDLPAAVLVIGWTFAGSGMGLIFPRLSVLTLRYSTTSDQGFNSAALSISDAVISSSSIAAMGLLFLVLNAFGAGFPAVFAFAIVLTLIAMIPGLRLGRAQENVA